MRHEQFSDYIFFIVKETLKRDLFSFIRASARSGRSYLLQAYNDATFCCSTVWNEKETGESLSKLKSTCPAVKGWDYINSPEGELPTDGRLEGALQTKRRERGCVIRETLSDVSACFKTDVHDTASQRRALGAPYKFTTLKPSGM
jgi:hypothetical protein